MREPVECGASDAERLKISCHFQFDQLTEPNSERSAVSFERDGMQLCQLVKRQFRFPSRQCESDNNVLTAKLAPQRGIRRPLLRLGSAQTLDPKHLVRKLID